MKRNCPHNSTFQSRLLAVAATTLLVGNAPALQINGLSNTGVDNLGNVLPLHSVDPHYAVSGVASVAYVVPKANLWVSAPPGSAWIGPNPTSNPYPSDPPGLYHYPLSFDLSGLDASQLRVSGRWATDNNAEIWLNGQDTGINKALWGFVALDPFSIESGFIPGINILEFRVENDDAGGPSGLLVADITPILVPEPSSAILAVLAAACILAFKFARGSRLTAWLR